MSYDTSRFSLLSQPIAGPKEWVYRDTGGENGSTFAGAGWFTDAKKHGVDTGDRIVIYDDNASKIYQGRFTTVQDTGNTQGTATLDTGPNYV